jgi:hypothetical protein
MFVRGTPEIDIGGEQTLSLLGAYQCVARWIDDCAVPSESATCLFVWAICYQHEDPVLERTHLDNLVDLGVA